MQQFCEGKVAEVRTAVLYEKSHSVVQCDYVWKRTDLWINFPWSDKDPVAKRGLGGPGRLSRRWAGATVEGRGVEQVRMRAQGTLGGTTPSRRPSRHTVTTGRSGFEPRQHAGQVVVGVGPGEPVERRHQLGEHHPRPLLGRHRPHLVLEHETVELAVVAADRDGAGTPEPGALPDHRVGVHVGAGLGDTEPRELVDLDRRRAVRRRRRGEISALALTTMNTPVTRIHSPGRPGASATPERREPQPNVPRSTASRIAR